MGPGHRRFRQMPGPRKEGPDRVMSVRAGEIPVFYDSTNPRVYRRLVCDWVSFQELAGDDSSRKLTRGQQVLAIITNIRGNAGLRVSNVASMLKKDMSREEFVRVVDIVLDIVDPLDRETAFLQTAKAWQDLMGKVHHKQQTYDKYWSEYSALSLHYAYSHGKAAKTTGIQELLALLCVLNAKLPRAEFGAVLQAAMGCQKDHVAVGASGLRPEPTMLVEPASATRTLSYYTDAGVAAEEEESNVTRVEESGGEPQGAEDAMAVTGGPTVSSTGIVRGTERTRQSVHESLGICSVELTQMALRGAEILDGINEVIGKIEGWPVIGPSEADIADVSTQLRTAAAKTLAVIAAMASAKSVVELLTATATENNLTYSVRTPSARDAVPLFGARGSDERHESPLITLEAVRMALRRIDQGELASQGVRRGRDMPGDNQRGNDSATLHPSARTGLSGRNPDLRCWVCDGSHFYYENPNCKQIYEERRSMKQKGGPVRSKEGTKARKGSQKKFGESALSNVRWAEPPGSSFSLMTVDGDRKERLGNAEAHGVSTGAIVDSGAMATVIGLANYVRYCDENGLRAVLHKRRPTDYVSHAFGTDANHSEAQEVVGRVVVPLPITNGVVLKIRCLAVDGNVPLILGKDTLKEHRCVEDHDSGRIVFNVNGTVVTVPTVISDSDGHARIYAHRDGLMGSVAFSMVQQAQQSGQGGVEIIRRIHSRTHLHPRSVELLLKRAGKWDQAMSAEIEKVQEACLACMRSGDPPPANKFSATRIHAKFNDRVYLDLFYWGGALVLHAVDYATAYSESINIDSRDLLRMLREFVNIWILRHGDPTEVVADAEFDRGMARKWARSMGLKFVTLPARRHNKAGPVERKHRVVKDALERLESDADHAKLSFPDRLAEANFVSNILYGSRVASSFELVRGYTPSLAGSGMRILPDEVRKAHEEMVSRRLLAKILKSRPGSVASRRIRIGDDVLVLLPGGKRPRGHWVKRKVRSVRADYSVVVGSGRGRCVVAAEDVRTIPKNSMAAVAVEELHGIREGESEYPKNSENNARNGLSSDMGATDEGGPSSSSSESDAPRHDHAFPGAAPVGNGDARPQKNGTDHEDVNGGNGSGDSPEDLQCHHDKAVENAGRISETAKVVATEGDTDPEDAGQAVDEALGDSAPPHEHEECVTTRQSGRIRKPVQRLNLLANPIDRAMAEQNALKIAHGAVGNSQFTAREMPVIPYWLYDKARCTELDENWVPNMRRISRSEVPRSSNVISSHFVYKVKIVEHEDTPRHYVLKARLCVHGNRDAERESMRTDAAVVSHDGFRLLYSIAACSGMRLGKADIRGAYTQSGVACRDVYVAPPREMQISDELWLLTATMYGLVSAGRKWQRTSDEMLQSRLGLLPVIGLPQLFYCYINGEDDGLPESASESVGPSVLLAKYVDDLIIAGRNDEWLEYTHDEVCNAFELSTWMVSPSVLTVNTTRVMQTEREIVVSMSVYLREIECLRISAQRRKEICSQITHAEERRLKSLAGKVGYVATTVSPFAAFVASFVQQQIPTMTVAGLKNTNALVRELLRREPVLSYLQPSLEEQAKARIVVFSDAGFPHQGELKKVAQEGCIVGVAFGSDVGCIYHTIMYQSRKQRRVATSAGEAETIAAVTAVGCARALQHAYRSVMHKELELVLVVDSRGLHRCLATQSTPRDRGMIADVHRLRCEYESGKISDIVWVAGTQNPADALTKPNAGATTDLLEKLLVDGRLPVAVNDRCSYGPALKEEL